MSFYRYFILLSLSLYCCFCCRAQDSNYIYKDSAIFYDDSVKADEDADEDAGPVQKAGVDRGKDITADTTLRNNELFIERDSIRALKNSKPFYYAKHLDSLLNEYRQNLERDEAAANREASWIGRFFMSPITKYFFWILAGIFISFILYKLFFAEGFFQRSYAKINVAKLPEEEEDPSKITDYASLINRAVSNRNFRAAVRYHYLQSLQKLASKGAIQYATDKTNYQYLRELSGKPYKDAFASLTLNYEYVWYGEFVIDENIFNSIQNKFKQFNSGV